MRKLSYLSPTSLAKWLEDQDSFYMLYLADVRAPREKQTRPMSIGSAFDAYIKSHLFERLIGKGDPDWPKFQFDAIFEKQVDPYNRDWARNHGKYVFDQYVKSGALADIFVELEKAIGKPRFELDIMGYVSHDILTVPLMGKPDIFFVNKEGYQINFDWKVNGYCSKTGASPSKGYVKIIPGHDAHKDAFPTKHRGVMVNACCNLEDVDESWARQTTIYGWLCGCTVGSDFALAIDQVACNNRYNSQPGIGYPDLRFAQHRYRATEAFQQTVYRQAAECWEAINSDHIFRGLSKEQSQERCDTLDKRAKSLFDGPKSEEDKLFDMVCE